MKKVFFAITFSVLAVTGCASTEAPFDQLAKCMTEKGVIMYGADTCSHCIEQKKSFKGSFELINYVECRKNQAECEKAEIMSTPTWLINGKKYVGKKSLSELAERSGCTLTTTKTE